MLFQHAQCAQRLLHIAHPPVEHINHNALDASVLNVLQQQLERVALSRTPALHIGVQTHE
jgi:hypothetical protein